MGLKITKTPRRKKPSQTQLNDEIEPGGEYDRQEPRSGYPNGPTHPSACNLNLGQFPQHQDEPIHSPTRRHVMQMSASSSQGNFNPPGAEVYLMPPSPTNSNDEIVVCLFDFTARVHRELGFKTNDRLKIVRKEDDDWLYALHLYNNNKGLIPANYVASEKSLKSYEWYFGDISRRNAESILLRTELGTFLVRDSRTQPGDFALSIKSVSETKGPHIRHYIIKLKDGHYSIFNKIKFSNLNDLLQEYKVRSHGISVLLTNPCQRMMPTRYDLSADTRDVWEINRSEVELLEEIGHGNFGSVYRGMWRGTTEVAVKTLIIGKMSSDVFLDEAKIMKGLRHENILALLATCSKEEPIYIITEFMKLGSLLSLLKEYKRSPQSLDEDHMLGFAFQIAKGMEYLEQKKLVHRDLAARNVLVNDVPICKIADFGLAKIVEEDINVCKDKFPVKWSPPETFLKGEFSIKSDVWAFGIVVMEIFTYGDPVYPGMTPKEVQQNVKNGYRLPRPELMPEPTYEVIRKCWSKEPLNRPEFAALAEFFDESRHKTVDGTQYLTEEAFMSLQT